MEKYREVVKRPIITEKSSRRARERNEYTFEVAKEASKGAIKKALEDMFNVSVLGVRTVAIPSKPKRALGVWKFFATSPKKKAVAKLKEGDKIEGFETGE